METLLPWRRRTEKERFSRLCVHKGSWVTKNYRLLFLFFTFKTSGMFTGGAYATNVETTQRFIYSRYRRGLHCDKTQGNETEMYTGKDERGE